MKLASALLSFSNPGSPVSTLAQSLRPASRQQQNDENRKLALGIGKSTSCAPVDASEIRAFAKLQGRSWTYYVQKVSVVIGRNLDSASDEIDVHIGDSEAISKKHLRIDYAGPQGWEMYCFGKSGVTVDGQHYEAFCQPIVLAAKSLISIGGVDFYFLLPIGVEPRGVMSEADSDDKRRSKSVVLGSQLLREEPPMTQAEINATKPFISYACLIAEAINGSPDNRLTLADIYKYLMDKYPYFRHTKNGWQNSIRHNLSLNKAFVKIPRSAGEPGKGMFWVIDQNHRHLVEGKPYQRRSSGPRQRTMANPTFTSYHHPGALQAASVSHLHHHQQQQHHPHHHQAGFLPMHGAVTAPHMLMMAPPMAPDQQPPRAMSSIPIPPRASAVSPTAHHMLLEAAQALENDDSIGSEEEASESDNIPSGVQSAPAHIHPQAAAGGQQPFHPQPSRPFVFNGMAKF